MIRPVFIPAAILLSLAAAPAFARDERLATRLYNPDEVVRIEGRAGVQATVAFHEDEHIENVAIGDSNSWQVTPNKRANLLFVKPLSPRARTNMTVVTDRHTYFFDLVAGAGAAPLYVLRFTYPAKAEEKAAAPAGLTPDEALAMDSAPADPANLNFAWAAKGKARLVPARIYDDGTATYLAWAAGVPIPAIQIRDEKGAEGPVNYAVRGDVIVVDGVPPLIVLRAGKDSATLERRGDTRSAAKSSPRKDDPQGVTPAATSAVAVNTLPQGQ
jgi:type IV secretion system protein VirB9